LNVTIDSWPVLLLSAPMVYIVLALGLILALVGLLARSPFPFIASMLCFFTCLFSDEFADYTWVLMAFGMMIVWCVLAMIKLLMTRGGEG
jgi:hypothetical protein